MALLRQCLQELRTRQHERHASASGWPQSRPLLQQPLAERSLLAPLQQRHPEIASDTLAV